MIRMRVSGGRAVLLAILLAGNPWAAAAQAPAPVAGAEASMKGKIVLITGSTDGLGREVALRVGALGAHVLVHGRNAERGKAVVDEIARQGQGSARFYAADFASLADVRSLAAAIRRDYDRLDVLVNNAGVLLRDRQVSRDGHEMHFAVNYLAGFLLTRTLLPMLVASAPARIVNVASGAQSPLDFDDLMLERPGRSSEGYGHSKLAQILFTIDLAEELKGRNVLVTALHPATMMDTGMVRDAGMRPQSTVSEGADAVMQQITGRDVQTAQFYNGRRPARAHPQAYDEAARRRLRDVSMRLTGLAAP